MIRTRRWSGALLLALLIGVLVPSVVSAHPLGNVSINHYAAVTVSQTEVRVDVVIDTAEIPTVAAVAALDQNGSGTADPDELADARMGECETRLGALSVAVDGRPVRLVVERATLELVPGAQGLPTLRTECLLVGQLEAPIERDATLTITDASDPDRLGWREIVVLGDGLTPADADAGATVSHRLTIYPDDLLQRPLDERSVTVELRPGGPAVGIQPMPDAPATDAGAFSLPATPIAVLIGLALAVLAGAGHAISPGHGKTLMAAYLVGSHGRRRDAVVLGLGVTVSHTVGVVALGGVVLLAGAAIPADRIYPVLSAIAGVAVVGIGATMLIGCVRRLRAHRRHAVAHAHGHAHDHGHDHGHDHDLPVPGRMGVLAIGLAGGLVPSPAALLLLLGAVAAGEPAYGLGLALAFGLGMAGVLAGLGLVVVGGRDLASGVAARLPGAGRLTALVPWAASVIVLAGGVLLTGQAVIGRL